MFLPLTDWILARPKTVVLAMLGFFAFFVNGMRFMEADTDVSRDLPSRLPAKVLYDRIDDLAKAVREMQSREWRITCAPHHNHQDTEPYQVAGPLWFDQHLQGTFAFPHTPQTALDLKGANGVPAFAVTPDQARKILSVRSASAPP